MTESWTVMSGPDAWMPTNGPIASTAVSPGMPKSDSPSTTWSSGPRMMYGRVAAVGIIRSLPLPAGTIVRSEEHTSELQSHHDLVCRLLLEKKKKHNKQSYHPKTKNKTTEST